ncbi:hypothetical protein CBR_g4781 [Chara braunii]|uniref:Uncharacterized protein n=1 Tax=Chara braunii TaxID=69332 RepID=A0A388KIS7_CHABU|nr:hypothetical protein CBR_g4781 [Chara braunii]|eukprot:GBG69954.1 hypothetical protein CBR_g4781 [Chara braunii]
MALGSGSTQEWAGSQLYGSHESTYLQSYAELLQEGLHDNDVDSGVNLSFGPSSESSPAATWTVLVKSHPDNDVGQVTAVSRSAKGSSEGWEASDNRKDPSRLQSLSPSTTLVACGCPQWMRSPFPLSGGSSTGRRAPECGATDADFTGELRGQQEEWITRGVQRLHVGEQDAEKEPPVLDADDYGDVDNDDEWQVDGAGYVSPFKNKYMGCRGRNNTAFAFMKGRRGKKVAPAGSEVEGGNSNKEDDSSTEGSSPTTGSPGGFRKRNNMRQQTFEALTECMEKHGTLMATTMKSASKRQCSIQMWLCEALDVEVEVKKKHYSTSDKVGKLMCHALMESESYLGAVDEGLLLGRTEMWDRLPGLPRTLRPCHLAAVVVARRGTVTQVMHRRWRREDDMSRRRGRLLWGGASIEGGLRGDEWVRDRTTFDADDKFEEAEAVGAARKVSKRAQGGVRIDNAGAQGVIDVVAVAMPTEGAQTARVGGSATRTRVATPQEGQQSGWGPSTRTTPRGQTLPEGGEGVNAEVQGSGQGVQHAPLAGSSRAGVPATPG